MAIITISRGSFAGGRKLAEALARRLEHPALSREQVLLETAEQYGIAESDLKRALNESPPFWHQLPGKRVAYVKCVTAVLLEHASSGNLIYHGNVGHLLLAEISHVLRVRVVADLNYRVQAAMEHANLRREEALAHIQQMDEERSRWARQFYGVDWTEPTQYSVVLNLGQVSTAGAAEIVARLAGLPEFQPTPDSQKRFEDLRLSCRVWAALARSPDTRSAGLEVTAEGGAVIIRGSVGSVQGLEKIPQIAAAVPGVTHVQCEAGMGSDWGW